MYKIHNHSSKLCSNLFVPLNHVCSHNIRSKEQKNYFLRRFDTPQAQKYLLF